MSVFKVHKKNNYSIISNNAINDDRLSWKARGILIYLLSKPGNWEPKLKDLINNSEKDGEVSVKNALKELRVCGYAVLRRGEFKDINNNIKFGSFYDVYEEPQYIQP